MAKARMLGRNITQSKKVSLISPYAKLLYTWLVPFTDDYGRYHADPDLVKSNIFPRERAITEDTVEELLAELVEVELITVYDNGESRYLQFDPEKFEEWQTFRSDRPRHSEYPEYDDGMSLVYQRDTNGSQTTKQVKLREVKLSCTPTTADGRGVSSFVEGSDPYDLAAFLAEQIRANNERARTPDLDSPAGQKWCKVFDLMIRRDGLDHQEIAAVIAWLPTHEGSNGFRWGDVILSPVNFRKKYAELYAAARKSGAKMRLDKED